jgi:magnesium chelatase accessory protein
VPEAAAEGAAGVARGDFVEAAGLRWFVQHAGQGGPTLLLLHGTGASVHSFAALMPRLAHRCRLLAIDLPGHGRSSRAAAAQCSLPGMGRAIAALLETLAVRPDIAVGHSAGAALLVRMALDGHIVPREIVAINGAFLPYGGALAPLLSPLARLLYGQAWVPRLFARRAADAAVVRRLIEGTGSRLDDTGIAAYQALMQRPGQAEAALAMMAHWDLRALARDLPQLALPLHLLVGARDRAVPPAQARRVAARCRQARVTLLDGVGHLAHEEAPGAVAECLLGAVSPQRVATEARV